MSVKNISYHENRLVEDTIGATMGAAAGASVSTVVGLVIPAIVSIVPLGLIIGSLAGVVVKEIAQRRERLEYSKQQFEKYPKD